MKQIARPNHQRAREYLAAGALSPYSRVLLFDYLEKINGDEIEIEYDEDMTPTDPIIAVVHERRDLSAILYVGELPPLEKFNSPLISLGELWDVYGDSERAANIILCSLFYVRAVNHWIELVYDRGEWSYRAIKLRDMQHTDATYKKTLAQYATRYKQLLMREDIVFVPWCKRPVDVGNSLNLFTGFAHKYDANFQPDEEMVALITSHLREVWCGGDARKFDYLIKWLAWILQRPQEKLPTFIVVEQNAYCSTRQDMCEFLMNKVYGAANSLTTVGIDVRTLTSKYNAILKGRLLITASPSPQTLRAISRQEITIRHKYSPVYTIPDLANYIITPEGPLRGFTGQAFLYLRTRQQSLEYCARFKAALFGNARPNQNIENGIHFFHYLANIDLTNFNPHDDLAEI